MLKCGFPAEMFGSSMRRDSEGMHEARQAQPGPASQRENFFVIGNGCPAPKPSAGGPKHCVRHGTIAVSQDRRRVKIPRLPSDMTSTPVRRIFARIFGELLPILQGPFCD